MTAVIRLTDITPKWLDIPASLATDTNEKVGPTLFRKLAKEQGLDWPRTKLGSEILNLFQESADIMEGICGHEHTASKVHMHKVFGDEKAAIWSFGFALHAHEFIMARIEDEKLALKTVQLLTRVTMLKLEGQYTQLEARRANEADFKKTARLMTAYSNVTFPIALLKLFQTGDLAVAITLLESEDLLELGFWFHAENDFLDHFELSRPRNTELMDYTMLIDLLRQEFRPGEFIFPKRKEQLQEVQDDNDVFYKYVVAREKAIKAVEAKVKEPAPRGQDLVHQAKKEAVEYFRDKHQLCAYAITLPDFTTMEYHKHAAEITRRFHAWVRNFPKSSIIYQFSFQYDFVEWIAYSYPFIEDIDVVVEINKMCVTYVPFDDLMERSPHLADDVARIFESCLQPGFLEDKVDHAPFVWSDPDWPLLPQMEHVLREHIKVTKRLQQMLGDFGQYRTLITWVRGVPAIRDLVAEGNFTVPEYITIRNHESQMYIWCQPAAAWAKESFFKDFGFSYVMDYNFASFLQNELISYGVDVILNKEKPKHKRDSMLLNVVDFYRFFDYPGESIQDVVFRLNKEERRILKWLHSFESTKQYYMVIVFWGFQYHVLSGRYSRSAYKSKNTAICLMH